MFLAEAHQPVDGGEDGTGGQVAEDKPWGLAFSSRQEGHQLSDVFDRCNLNPVRIKATLQDSSVGAVSAFVTLTVGVDVNGFAVSQLEEFF